MKMKKKEAGRLAVAVAQTKGHVRSGTTFGKPPAPAMCLLVKCDFRVRSRLSSRNLKPRFFGISKAAEVSSRQAFLSSKTEISMPP